jgi:hypothetical protein
MTTGRSGGVARSARARQVVAAGRRLLEEEGVEARTMRRLAERLGIQAPSLVPPNHSRPWPPTATSPSPIPTSTV